MSFLDEYKNMIGNDTNNDFPETMEYDGLTENDREMYEEVLGQMRADMDKANEEMRKKSGSFGKVCEEINGRIKNNTYKLNEEMLRSKLNEKSLQSYVDQNGKMRPVNEPFGFMIDSFRCPKCGKLMYEENGSFICGSCGYTEETDLHMKFYFIDNTFTKTPIPEPFNTMLCEAFADSNKNIR